MPQSSAVNVVFGTASLGKQGIYGMDVLGDLPSIQLIFNTFKDHGHHQLDTARRYAGGTTETLLGEIDYAGQGLIVDTKVLSGSAGAHTPENVLKSIDASLKELKTNKVNIMYLHAPDRATSFAETLATINEEYKKGRFARFGLSNYKAEEVEEIVKIAKEKNYVLPTAYQGSYSLVARGGEEKLFPVLRKHGISFYAYSPLAGSFLTGAVSREKHNARFDPASHVGKMYSEWFCKESYFQALDDLQALGEKHRISMAEIALRWIAHHSQLSRKHGDSVIIGGKTLENIKNTLDWLDKGGLPADVLSEVQKISDRIIKDAPQYYM